MKLKELLDNIFDSGVRHYSEDNNSDYYLSHVMLDLLRDKLLECDEFKNVSSLTIIASPNTNISGKDLTINSMKIPDGFTFSGDVYINAIFLTPLIYDPSNLLISVKDGANITPQFYDTITFAPYRKIIIPYKTCDNIGLSRAETHKLLDKILDNEDEYMTKGTRGIMIRGIFL